MGKNYIIKDKKLNQLDKLILDIALRLIKKDDFTFSGQHIDQKRFKSIEYLERSYNIIYKGLNKRIFKQSLRRDLRDRLIQLKQLDKSKSN